MSFRHRLHTKLFLSHFLLALAVMVGVGAYVFESLHRTHLGFLEDSLGAQADNLAQIFAGPLAAGQYARIQNILALRAPGMLMNVLVTDEGGLVVASTEPEEARLRGQPSQAAGLREALRGRVQRAIEPHGEELVYVARSVSYEGETVGAIRLSYSLAKLEEDFGALLQSLLLGILITLAASGLVGFGIAVGLSRSAARLATAARALGQGDLTHRTRLDGRDELAEAGRAFDAMADRLQGLQLERQSLLNTLSHEIHSAVTGMGMALEVLKRGEGLDPESRDLLLGGLHSHGRRLRRLADDLLEAARLTRGQLTLRPSSVSPADLVRDVTASFAPEAAERGVRLESTVADGLPTLQADGDRLAQALGNLIENALRYTPAGRRVVVTADRSDGACLLEVHDEGPGIGALEASEEFQPLVPAGGAPTGRLGLGLTITKAVVEAHGGRLEYARRAEGGSAFRITLPVTVAAEPEPAAVAS